MTDIVRHCASAFLEIPATSQHDSVDAAKVSVQLAETSGHCDFEDTSRDRPASPIASQNDVASETVTLSIVSPASALQNALESTTAATEQVETLFEKDVIIEYPLTPAMSVSELQATGEEARIKPSPTAEPEPVEPSHCDIEPRTATAPLSERARTHYCPPSITTQPDSIDDEYRRSSPFAPMTTKVCAADVQVILQPPQDFYRTYIMEKLANGPPLSENDLQASTRAQAAVASPPRALKTNLALTVSNTWPDTPPASPGTELQENDLTSVTAALASYPLTAHLQTRDLKRPFTNAEVVDSLEERAKKRQKIAETSLVEEAEGILTGLKPLSIVDTLESGTEIEANPDTSGSETLTGEETSDTVANDFPNATTAPTLNNLTPSSQRARSTRFNPTTLTEHLAGAYTQPPDSETKERLTPASRSPTLAPPSLSLASTEPAKTPAPHQHTPQSTLFASHPSTDPDPDTDTDTLSSASDEELRLLATEVSFSSANTQDLMVPTSSQILVSTGDAPRATQWRKVEVAKDDVLGKRMTRRAARIEEERRRVAEEEGNIGKRLRGRGGGV